jgi:hypothetical protein
LILQIEVPDDWTKKSTEWKSSQIMFCSQCPYKTPVAAMFVTHVFNTHGMYIEPEEATLTTAK